MTHDEIRESLGAYALFALSDEERELVEAHLPTCEACREEVEQSLSVQGQLGLLAIERDPPPELRTRLMNLVELDRALWEREQAKSAPAVAAEAPRPGPAQPAAGWWRRLTRGLARVPRVAYGVGGIVVAVVIVVVVLANRTSVTVEHTYACTVATPSVAGANFSTTGCTLEVRSDHTTTVAFTKLPTLPTSRAYELWVIPGKGNPVPVGGFVAHSDQTFTGHYAVDASKYPLAAVSIEKAPGKSLAPHGPIVLTVSLKG